MKYTDIKIWYECNNYCFFCIQWDKRKKYKSRTLDEIKNILLSEYKKGVKWVNFTWWEPTIHKTLIPAVEYAKEIWYLIIKIQSNWQTFSDLEYYVFQELQNSETRKNINKFFGPQGYAC
jgi:molybdenum cofactor biosynthesis enzyme MoaA